MKFRISGTDKQVDQATKESIKHQYSIESEIKLLRRALYAIGNGDKLPEEFVQYHDFVEHIVAKRKLLKGRVPKHQVDQNKR